MSHDLDDKLVIAVAGSALFDLGEPDRIFVEQGISAYRAFQREHENVPLPTGVAFEFIKRFLSLNDPANGDCPVAVVFISENDPDTGARLLNSASHYGLDVTRGAFLGGGKPWPYISAFNASLFLSANEANVREAILNGSTAGCVLRSTYLGEEDEGELRVAFDFDGVIADDEAEAVYRKEGMEGFRRFEEKMAMKAHNPGPLKRLFEGLGGLQRRETERKMADPLYKPRIKIAIVTARNAPAHQRLVTSLRQWGILVDQTFFLGGISKKRVLGVFKPHLFFDDQIVHLEDAGQMAPCVLVPCGRIE